VKSRWDAMSGLETALEARKQKHITIVKTNLLYNFGLYIMLHIVRREYTAGRRAAFYARLKGLAFPPRFSSTASMWSNACI